MGISWVETIIVAASAACAAGLGAWLGRSITTQARWSIPSLVIGFMAGAAVSSLALYAANSSSGWWLFNSTNSQQFFEWLGEFIQSFAPWGVIFFFLILFPQSRAALSQILRAPGDLVSGIGESLASGASISSPWVTVDRKLTKLRADDYDQWTEIFVEQRSEAKRRFDKKTSKSLFENKIKASLKTFCDEYLFPCIKSDAKLYSREYDGKTYELIARCAIHMRDRYFDEKLYQLTEYYDANGEFSSGQRSRRFSIRHGIIGKCYRKNEFYIDPQVSIEPIELVDTWGFTKREASERGRLKESHLAVPVCFDASGEPTFVIFCDAGPSDAFTVPQGPTIEGTEKSEQKDSVPKAVSPDDQNSVVAFREWLERGIKESGLEKGLLEVSESVADEPVLFPTKEDR